MFAPTMMYLWWGVWLFAMWLIPAASPKPQAAHTG